MKLRILVLLLALAALAAAWATGLHERIDLEPLRDVLRGSGAWGPALFVVLFSLASALGTPGSLFLFSAIAIWPPWHAFALNWLGALGAGICGFWFARTLGRDWVRAHLPTRLGDLDARVTRHGLRTVLVMRLTLYLAAPGHWALGLSSVPFRTYALGSALGFLPWTALWTFAGHEMIEAVGGGGGWLVVLGLVAAAVAIQRLASREREPSASTRT